MRIVAYPIMLVSAVGVLASFMLQAASYYAGPGFEKRVIPVLFPGIFLVWLPTVLFMNRLARDFKQKDVWRAALRGCPSWMRKALWMVCGYVMFAAFALPLLRGSNPGASPGSFIIFPAAFYSVSFCVMYSALHVEKIDVVRRCLNGHAVSPLAKFCEECGAPAAVDGMADTVGP